MVGEKDFRNHHQSAHQLGMVDDSCGGSPG
jgi:hypothetical protein